MKQMQKGFTLIELMIVVAIIGILAAVAIPAYQDYVVKAKLSKVQSTLDPIKLALGMYYQENGSFPIGGITTATASAAGNLWNSIGIALTQTPTLPAEVSLLDVTAVAPSGTAPPVVDLTLTIGAGRVKATTIDGLLLNIRGTATGTAISWTCEGGTTVTDPIALKFFSTGQPNPATCV